MTLTTRVAVACTVLLLIAPTGVVGGTVAGSAQAGEAVTFVRTVEEAKGHLAVTVRFVEAGDREAAATHAGHPVEEYWSALGPDIRAANETLAEELKSRLEALPERARSASPAEYERTVRVEIYPLFDRAIDAVAGDAVDDPTFNAEVVYGLLQRSLHEYREGVDAEGTVTDAGEYWDARGFAIRAEARFDAHVKGEIDEHGAEEVAEMFETLDRQFEDAVPPDEVERLIGSMGGELAEYTGLEIEVEGDGPSATVERIEHDLHEAVEAYEAGNPDRAKQLIRQTYLTNFEGLEGELIEVRPDLVEELETDFNEVLPGLIDDGAPVSEVRKAVEEMEGKLHEVEEALAERGQRTIVLDGDDDGEATTEPTEDTPTATATRVPGDDTGAAAPGFGLVVALLALAGGALLASRRRP